MTEQEKRVWEAIYEALCRVGDSDINAGLSWLASDTDDTNMTFVARAAICAVNLGN